VALLSLTDSLQDSDGGGGAQLRGYDNASARVVAIAAGPATVSARFRRAIGEAALVVVPQLP
jgi:hypothetical protein